MKDRVGHYKRVQEWFDKADESKQRGLNLEYGYLTYALYIIQQMDALKDSKVLVIGCGDGLVMKKNF